MIRYLKGQREIREIPRNQRYICRPELEKIFRKDVVRMKPSRDKKKWKQ